MVREGENESQDVGTPGLLAQGISDSLDLRECKE